MSRRGAVTLLLALAMWIPTAPLADQLDWLLGKWELAFDPDGGEKDWIEFKANGRVISTGNQGGSVAGEYVVEGSEIQMTFHRNGKTIPLVMKFNQKRDRLLNFSKRTGSSAEYRKVP